MQQVPAHASCPELRVFFYTEERLQFLPHKKQQQGGEGDKKQVMVAALIVRLQNFPAEPECV